MAPIPILYVLDELHDARSGGTERQFAQLVARLDRRRFAPDVAVFRPTRFTSTGAGIDCPIHLLGIGKLAHPLTLLRLLGLSRTIRTGGFRVAHVFFTDASIAAPPFCRLGGAKVVVSRRDTGFWYTPALLRLLRVSNCFVSRVVANSDAVRETVHRYERYPPHKTDVLRNGLDPRAFDARPLEGLRERFGIGADDPIVGMVAHFHPWKRQDDLLTAFSAVHRRHPRAHLLFVGSGERETAVRDLCPPELRGFVHFAGAAAEALPIVKHLSVGVLCSDSEGSSNAVLEYQAAGLPVVCTSAGGNRELVTEGGTGFLVCPGDTPALADRIGRLLSDRAAAAAMGQRAREAAQQYSLDRMVDCHMALYESLAFAGARPC